VSGRRRPSLRVGLTATAAIVLVVGALALASSGGGHARTTTRTLAATDPTKQIGVSLILRMPHRAALDRFLTAIENPRSSSYGQTLRPSQFGARFGLPTPRLAELQRALRARRLTVARVFPQRTSMLIRGTVGELESVFATHLVDRVDTRGQRYFAPATRPRIPGWLATDVQGVTGLSTQPVMRAADVPAGGLDPGTLAKAYDFAPLRAQGITGTGQTVAVISFDSFENADLTAFQSRFGITGPAVEHVQVHGGTLPGPGQQEVNLDIDTIRSIAPGAQIIDYEAPQGATTDADVINQIVADHRARVISSSWGRCDLLVTDADRTADETALAAARAAGITVFAASGDNGAYDCQAEDLTDQRLSVDWPAASENVVAVGGTRLAVRKDGTYLAEYGWEDMLKGDGSGGGLASATPRPAWQTGPGVQNAYSNGRRQLPDVAGPADPDSGMVVISGGSAHQVGGTSAAAPFWAGTLLLASQYAQRHGGRELGFVAPALYAIAADPRTANAFHHSIRGGNRRYSVTAGWNYVDGLGSPDVAVLARDLAAASPAH
jgi:subtilase family serine protease